MEPQTIEEKFKNLRRDFIDLAAALGADANFQAVAQRVADLLNKERRYDALSDSVRQFVTTPAVASLGQG